MSIKRNKLIKHLEVHGCHFHRHGSKHDIYKNEFSGKKTTIPRHPQMDKNLCTLICKQLEIPTLD
ncbi:type II toxin-antitoxin system HicA family toxin [Runella sp.]|jgi:predicted RNA binding protein YcfA (HicA-like mRNA interferase family)|uniref:type II toxin-antitoxin system HicA family toxin n=1 Tax=Runella sp. TaxID=1960881 RepID=UPI002632C2F4|nr:type II toxin-antitoxin system HicA family toxin [Runella sp.]